MASLTHRIDRDQALGRSQRGLDMTLGILAVVPILAAALAVWRLQGLSAVIVRTLAVVWASSLLTFFAGVRRGLTFSEAGGARPAELGSMLALFAIGVVAMGLCSPIVSAIGLALVGVLDAMAGRRLEAPRYFRLFRPLQMAVCVAGMIVVQLRGV